MSVEKIMYSGNSKTRKVKKNEMNQNNMVIGWLPNFEKIFLYSSNRPSLYTKREQVLNSSENPQN